MQVQIANLYPSCPQPEYALGMPSHSDLGLLTLLVENEVGGLQVEHKGKWFNVNAIPNFLVNTGDQLEVHYSCSALSTPLSPFRKVQCPNLHQPTPTFNLNYVIWILAS